MNHRRKFLKQTLACGCCLTIPIIFQSCSDVAISNRKQLKIYPESMINKQAANAYTQIKQSETIISNSSESKNLTRIGNEVTFAVEQYFKRIGQIEKLNGFNWEFILIDNDDVLNAWCMPGGKIAFYTGIMDIAQNNDGIASIMGHEIAHAVARHSVERASQSLVINLGTKVADIFLEGALSTTSVDDYLVQLGLTLPFSRMQESEADYLGLAFMTMAGYNNNEAYKIWERMSKAFDDNLPPEFLSTHPSPDNRIQKIKNWLPEINAKFA